MFRAACQPSHSPDPCPAPTGVSYISPRSSSDSKLVKVEEPSVAERVLASIFFFLIGGFYLYLLGRSRLKAEVIVKLKCA